MTNFQTTEEEKQSLLGKSEEWAAAEERELQTTRNSSSRGYSEYDQGYAWVVLFASYLNGVLRGILLSGLGVYVVAFHERYDFSWSKVTVFSALQSSIGPLLGIPCSILVKRVGCRVTCIASACLMSFGYMLMATVDDIYAVYIGFSLCVGIGSVSLQVPTYVPVQQYFKKYIGLGISMVRTGLGTGLLIGSPLTLYLINEYGFRGSLMIYSAIYLNLAVTGALYRPFKQQIIDHVRMEDTSETEATEKKSCFASLPPARIYIYISACFLIHLAQNTMIIFTFTRATQLGLNKHTSSWLASIVGMAALTSWIYGIVADTFGLHRGTVAGSTSIIAGTIMIVSVAETSTSFLFITQILFGVIAAAYNGLSIAGMVELLGEERRDALELANGFFSAMLGSSNLASNIITGTVMDATHNPNTPFGISGLLMFIGGVVICSQAFYFRQKYKVNKRYEEND